MTLQITISEVIKRYQSKLGKKGIAAMRAKATPEQRKAWGRLAYEAGIKKWREAGGKGKKIDRVED